MILSTNWSIASLPAYLGAKLLANQLVVRIPSVLVVQGLAWSDCDGDDIVPGLWRTDEHKQRFELSQTHHVDDDKVSSFYMHLGVKHFGLSSPSFSCSG